MKLFNQSIKYPAWRWTLIVSVSLLGASCTQAEPDFSGTSTVRLYRHSKEDVVTLKIPNGYLDHFVLAGPPVPGAKENRAPIKNTMYFIAETETLAPRSKENASAFEFPNSLTGETRFNIGTYYARLPHEVKSAVQSTYESRRITFSFSCIKPLEPKNHFGLLRYETTSDACPKQQDVAFRKDMYIELDAAGDVKTQVFCAGDEVPDVSEQIKAGRETSFNPMCEHAYFFAPLNAKVTIHHPRFVLKDWQSLQQRINALLASFVRPPVGPQPVTHPVLPDAATQRN